MRNDHDIDRRADELHQLFEEKGLALLLAPHEEDGLDEDEWQDAYKFFQAVAAATIEPFKVRLDDTHRGLGYRENWE